MKKSVRILIVEDNVDDANLAKYEIRQTLSDYEFQVVETHENFIRALETFQPDVILADYRLPHFDGMKALKLTLQHAPLTPLIIWTGSINEDVAVDCVKAGANNYIIKDNLKRLGPAILHALEERELQTARKQAEEEIQIRERQLHILLGNLPGPVYRCQNDAEFTMEFISDGIEELSGYKAEEFRQHRRHFGKMIHPDDQAKVWKKIRAAIDRDTSFELTYRIITATGEEKWVWEKGQGLRGPEGQVQALQGFITDITGRKQAEQKYQSIFENSMEGIFQSSPLGHYLNLNPAMARLYGYASSKEMIESVRDIATQIYVEPEKRAEFMSLLDAQNSLENFEARNYCKDGTIIWTSTSARAVRDPHGNTLYYEGFIQDITQRKRVEEALQNSEKRFRALIENGLDDISLLAADGTLLWESPSTIRNLGYAPDEFVGRNIFEIMHPEDLEWTRNTYLRLLKEPGTRQRGIFRLRRSDGTWRWMEAIASNMLHEPGVNAIVINYRDITEQKQSDIELQQRNADLALINALNEVINRGEGVDAVVNLMAREIKSNFSAEGATVYLLDPTGRSLSMQQYFLPSKILQKIEALIGRTIPAIEIPLREGGYFHRALQSGSGVIASDPKVIQQWMEEFVETRFLPSATRGVIRKLIPQIYKLLNIKSTILVPLISDGKAIGLLDISSPNIFTEEDLKRTENIGRQLSIAIRRKQVEEELRESQSRYQNLVETSHDLIWSVDAEARFTFVNRASREIYGYEPEELVGRSFFEVMDPEHYHHNVKKFKETIVNVNELKGVESYVRHRDGRQIILSANSIVLRDEHGNITGVAGSSHDITQRKRVEDVLKEERNLLRTLIDNIPDRIYAMDRQGRKTLSNIADWKASRGKTMEDVVGKTDFDLYPPELAEEFWKLDRAVLDSGQPAINHEEPGLDASGNFVSILTSKIPLHDDEGNVTGLVGIGRDITERKQTEQRINDLLAFNEKILNHSPMGILTYKFTGECVFANENAALMAGTNIEQLKALNFHLLESWKKSGFYDLVQKAMAAFLPVTADIHHTSTFGKELWMTVHCTTFKLKGEDHLLIFLTDITERKQVEEKLRRNESQYRLATKATNDVIWEWDPKTNQLLWSENAQHVFGYPEGEIGPDEKWWDNHLHPDDRTRVLTRLDALIAGHGSNWLEEYRFLLQDGSYAYISDRGYIERDEHGAPIRMIGAMSDITSRKEAETERQALLEIMQGLANTKDLQQLLKLVHQAIAKVIYAENFFVVLHQENTGLFEEIYSVDQYDPPAPPSKLENSITSYVFRSGEPLLLTQASFDELAARGEVELIGTDSASWLGVPLKTSGRTIGVMAAQDYENDNRYSEREKDFLTSIATQVALVIERKRAEEALRESEEHYRTIFEGVQDAIFVESLDGKILMVNERACEMFGYSQAEFLTKTVADLVPPGRLILMTDESNETLSAEPRESVNRRANGQVFPIEISGRVQIINGEQVLLVVVRDITERKQSEDLIRESEERFSSAFEYASIGMALVTIDGRWSRVNGALCRLLGYSQDELLQKTFQDITHPDDLENDLAYVRQLQSGEINSYQMEKRYFHKTGYVVWALLSASLVRDEQGQPRYFISQIQDVTERKNVERDLRNAREFLQGVQDSLSAHIAILDEQGRIVQVNTAWCTFGEQNGLQDPSYGVGVNYLDICDAAAGTDAGEAKQIAAAIREILAGNSKEKYVEYPCNSPAENRWFTVRITRFNDGEHNWVILAHENITVRKQIEESLRDEQEKAQKYLNTAGVLMLALDRDGIVTLINQKGCEILGYSDNEIIGKKWIDTFLPEAARQGARNAFQNLISGELELAEYHENPILTKTGEQPLIAWHNTVVRDESGNIISTLSSGEDITERRRAEDELRASEERFLQLADNIQEAFWMTDAQSGREIYMSPAVETIWSRSIQSLMYEPNAWVNSVFSEDRPALQHAVQREKNGEKVELEYRIVRPDGTLRWIWDRAFPIFDDAGRVKRIAGISADITERKEAAEKLHESEDRYHSLFQNQIHGSALHEIITNDQGQPIDYTFLKVNPAFEKMTGLKSEDILGRRVTEVLPDMENERLIQIYGQVALTGQPIHLNEYFTPQGRYYDINVYSTRHRQFAVSFMDVTERIQAEQELRKLSRAVEQSGSTIVITDTAGNIEYINPKFTQITGYSFEEVIGQNPRMLKSGFTSDEEYRQLWKTISSGKEWHGELLNKKKDGTLFWESVMISPILNDRREITHFVGVKEDITERKQNEIETRRHIAELEAVYENGLSVSRLLEPGEIGNCVIETFARYLPWHHVTIRLRKEGSDDLELVSFNLPNLKEHERTDTEQHFIARINKVGQGLSGWVIQTGAPFRTGNVHVHPQYIDTHAGIQSGLYMPLQVGERIIGVISVESEAPNAFTEQDERLLATLANQTAVAFENARLYEAMQMELSERKRAEDALRISETHYRALADSITDILFELDQNLHYTHWNKASETLTGIPAEEAIGKSMEEILGATQEQTRIKTIYQEVLRTQKPKTFETMMVVGGENRSFEVNAYPSMRGVSVVAKDVTDRKRNETIMQKRFELMEFSARHSLNELMLRTVDEVSEITGSTIGFFHFIQEDQVHLGMQTWSTTALQLFKVDPADGGHLPVDQAGVWAEAIHQRRPLIQNDYESLLKKKGVPRGHVPIVREMVIPIIRNERIMAVMGIGNKPQDYSAHDLELAARLADYAWDITERKQMELALEIERNQLVQRVEERTADLSRANSNLARALRVKDEFLANMSHELRTPLNAILGLSESLGEQIAGPLNEKQQKYISTISESGHHLLSLINDILDLAKIDAGQITLDINKVDIHSVCQASLRMVKQLAQKKNQEISLEIDTGLGLMWADERRLKQMIVNLLGNAVKFTPEYGKLGLEVRGDEEANQIAITVWDNGIGIKQDDLARLFQPFVQLDSGLAREATGTGLGLALVAQMARLHGGSVNAVSNAGTGSRFTIVLPWEPALAVDTASRMRITGKFRAIQFDEKNKPTILLVEDTKEVVMMLRDYLELAGYKVFTAQDGVDGIVQARHVKPDLILMDVQMPRMDGFETTRKLRSDPNFRYTPIIALTALAMPHDRERCLEAGMDEYISKPVNLKALIKIIQNCLFEQESRTR